MKISRRQLSKLIKESVGITGKQFIMNNASIFKSMGWNAITSGSGLLQLEYNLPNHAQIVIYQEEPWHISHKDNINTYVISSNIKGIWGLEAHIDLTDLTLIRAIIDLINQATASFGGEIENLKQGIELFAFASEDPNMIKAASLLDEALTPALL